jgi:RNA polymerase sigma-70 factor (ECF subfamily)
VYLGDSGGTKQAAPHPVSGADNVAALLVFGLTRFDADTSVEPVRSNGRPGLVVRRNGEIDSVVAMRVEDGLITGLYSVRDPAKLSRVQQETALSR